MSISKEEYVEEMKHEIVLTEYIQRRINVYVRKYFFGVMEYAA